MNQPSTSRLTSGPTTPITRRIGSRLMSAFQSGMRIGVRKSITCWKSWPIASNIVRDRSAVWHPAPVRLIPRLVACAVLLAACTTPSTTSQPATGPNAAEPNPTSVASATATVEVPAATDFSNSELCPGGTTHTCRVAAGEHHSGGFGDGIAFTLIGSWIVRANETDLISLETGDANNPQALELITGALR